MSESAPTSCDYFCYKIINEERQKFNIKFSIVEKKLEIEINEEATMSTIIRLDLKLIIFRK